MIISAAFCSKWQREYAAILRAGNGSTKLACCGEAGNFFSGHRTTSDRSFFFGAMRERYSFIPAVNPCKRISASRCVSASSIKMNVCSPGGLRKAAAKTSGPSWSEPPLHRTSQHVGVFGQEPGEEANHVVGIQMGSEGRRQPVLGYVWFLPPERSG